MPLAWFSDPVKVTVSLCSKTLWDERIPNWVETLVCNCLIPFCLIQEKEKERATEAQTARESHLWYSQMRLTDMELNILDDSVGRSDRAHPLLFFFFLYCHRWDKSVRGFCCLRAHRWSVLYDPDVPSLFYTEAAIVCANKTSLPSDHFHWTRDTVWKYVLRYSGKGKGSRQQYLCLFQFAAHIKRQGGKKMQQSCQGLHSDSLFFSFIVAFCVLFIKNNNGLLSLSLAGSQAGTIRGRVIGRTGWGICWRRHGP